MWGSNQNLIGGSSPVLVPAPVFSACARVDAALLGVHQLVVDHGRRVEGDAGLRDRDEALVQGVRQPRRYQVSGHLPQQMRIV